MTDDSEPAKEPYEVGDRVQVRLADEDADSPINDTVGRVVHVFTDEPGMESEIDADRELDRASYRLEDTESGEQLPVVVRHRDLIPAGEDA